MQLTNVTLLHTGHRVNITVTGTKITGVATGNTPGHGPLINLPDSIAFPGLINSHDHLDFNCFSPLGSKTYSNYTEWGNHIHTNYKDEINAVLKIPQPLRTAWGMYKNLLAGVTTVINHGDFLPVENPLITIYQSSQNLHSVRFQKRWKWKLNNPLLKYKPCVIHTGEGTDTQSAAEIDELLHWNLLNRKLTGVHAVAMNGRQAKKFAGIVWCPESNQLLLNKHANIKQLKENTMLAFGTDSALTGNWNIWKHLRLARSLQLVGDADLFDMITRTPAKLWNINTGQLLPGKDADIVVARTNDGAANWNNFYSIDPCAILLILHKGKIRLFDASLLPQVTNGTIDLKQFSSIHIAGSEKFVAGNLPALMTAIKAYHPGANLPTDIFHSKPVAV